MSFSPRLLYLLLLAAMLALPVGCAPLNLKNPFPWLGGSDDKPHLPNRITTIWTDAMRYYPDRPPERGFGGRLLFYGAEDKPVKIDGTLVVYAFDETGRLPGNSKPDRKYVFPRELLPKLYSECGVGHSYSLWIPWDTVGGEQKEISLIVRFLPAGGAPVIGEMTKHLLSGTPPVAAASNARPAPQGGIAPVGQSQVHPVSYEAGMPAGQVQGTAANDPTQRMSTATIDVPPRLGRQLPVAAARPRKEIQMRPVPQRETINPAFTGSPAAAAVPRQAWPAAQPVPVRQGPPRPQAHYVPARSPAQEGQSALPRPDRSPWPQSPATSPSGPGPEPPSATGPQPAANVTAVGSGYY